MNITSNSKQTNNKHIIILMNIIFSPIFVIISTSTYEKYIRYFNFLFANKFLKYISNLKPVSSFYSTGVLNSFKNFNFFFLTTVQKCPRKIIYKHVFFYQSVCLCVWIPIHTITKGRSEFILVPKYLFSIAEYSLDFGLVIKLSYEKMEKKQIEMKFGSQVFIKKLHLCVSVFKIFPNH